jgi:hypothetical protein
MYTEPFVSIVSIAPQLLHLISPLYLHAPSLGLYARWSNGGYNVSIFHEILDATSILVVEFSEMGGQHRRFDWVFVAEIGIGSVL